MTNREYIIKKINEVLEQADNEKLADLFTEIIGFPEACWSCSYNDGDGNCDCTYYISKWIQSEDTSKQY